MVLLLNMFKATSLAAETTPVGYFFSHLFCSNIIFYAAAMFLLKTEPFSPLKALLESQMGQ
jgi:hypothetical protein